MNSPRVYLFSSTRILISLKKFANSGLQGACGLKSCGTDSARKIPVHFGCVSTLKPPAVRLLPSSRITTSSAPQWRPWLLLWAALNHCIPIRSMKSYAFPPNRRWKLLCVLNKFLPKRQELSIPLTRWPVPTLSKH